MATQLKKTVMPSGGDYTSLEACMNANEQNLVTADKYFDVEIDGTWSSADTTAVTIHNYTTDATRYINIYTTSAARHLGIYSNSYYSMENTGVSSIDVLHNTATYIRITGLQLCNTATSQTYAFGIWLDVANNTSSDVRISGCIIKRSVTTGVGYAYGIQQSGLVLTAWNNIIYNFKGTSDAGGFYCSTSNQNLYNNTIYNCKYGINRISGTVVIKNNICNGNTQDYSGTFGTTATNISQDSTSPDGASYCTTNGTAVFVNTGAGTENFHQASNSTNSIDRGTNLSATFTDDIDGVTRTGTWDIGADEYVASEPPATVTFRSNHLTMMGVG